MPGFGDQKKPKKKKKGFHPKQITGKDCLLENAIKYHLCGDLVNAESGYRKAIANGFQGTTALINLGIICKNSNRFDEAILLFRKAIETSPNEPDAYSNLAKFISKPW